MSVVFVNVITDFKERKTLLVQTHTHTRTHVRTHARTHARTRTRTHAHTRTRTHTHTHARTHMLHTSLNHNRVIPWLEMSLFPSHTHHKKDSNWTWLLQRLVVKTTVLVLMHYCVLCIWICWQKQKQVLDLCPDRKYIGFFKCFFN